MLRSSVGLKVASVIGVAVLFFICLCAGVLWYIDSNFLWCTFFPFLGGC